MELWTSKDNIIKNSVIEKKEEEENDPSSSSTEHSYQPVFSGSAIIRSEKQHAATATKLMTQMSRDKSEDLLEI